MDRDELAELTMKAIAAAMDNRASEAADTLAEIGNNGGPNRVYGACCAFAELSRAALVKLYGKQTPDLSRGEMWGMQILKAEADPYETFAARFIVAYANDDRAQTVALFDASITAGIEDHVSSVAQLLATAVQLARTALRHPEADRG